MERARGHQISSINSGILGISSSEIQLQKKNLTA